MQPAKKNSSKIQKLDTIEEMAEARFGSVEGLAIVKETTLGLAKHYAERFKLNPEDPEVSLITSALAFTRHKEFMLYMELERDLHSRVSNHPDEKTGYGQVLFQSVRTGAHREINRELDRLHSRASVYLKELKELSKDEPLS
tara:strand:+ start:999 stop:1424 length:426 start_codon:yes stop_codon:yes gene_type:complete